ncbi:MAG: hypothetical protein KGJ79_05030 [Alphaproteobacteria bacterium]|nr:hypothetical protein [Alphaproteobacteria bacterium]MDE2110484.1 hypothetical protein [Alphaproteobacteria bacterium]MDE2493234.1 hypothetical protein [Alphaproteobacteria bacterium]
MADHDGQAALGIGCCSMPPASDKYVTSDSESLSPELRGALKIVERSIEHLNEALQRATQAGATIELRRRARVHAGDGCWADQMAPLILSKSHS